MKGKSRGSNVEEYTDEQIFRQLQEWYGEENCIRFEDFVYVVLEEGTYYLMKQCIPDIFFTTDAKPLKKVLEISEDINDSITVKIDDAMHSPNDIYKQTTDSQKTAAMGVAPLLFFYI